MDVEFMVALGQLSLGADRALRTTSTMAALARLVARGWPATLVEDYAFLRRLALRLRLVRGRPEDVVSPHDLAPLARAFDAFGGGASGGPVAPRAIDAAGALAAELDRRMACVRAIYLTMFGP